MSSGNRINNPPAPPSTQQPQSFAKNQIPNKAPLPSLDTRPRAVNESQMKQAINDVGANKLNKRLSSISDPVAANMATYNQIRPANSTVTKDRAYAESNNIFGGSDSNGRTSGETSESSLFEMSSTSNELKGISSTLSTGHEPPLSASPISPYQFSATSVSSPKAAILPLALKQMKSDAQTYPSTQQTESTDIKKQSMFSASPITKQETPKLPHSRANTLETQSTFHSANSSLSSLTTVLPPPPPIIRNLPPPPPAVIRLEAFPARPTSASHPQNSQFPQPVQNHQQPDGQDDEEYVSEIIPMRRNPSSAGIGRTLSRPQTAQSVTSQSATPEIQRKPAQRKITHLLPMKEVPLMAKFMLKRLDEFTSAVQAVPTLSSSLNSLNGGNESFVSASNLMDPSIREKAAIIIQRWYRYNKMKMHFEGILRSVYGRDEVLKRRKRIELFRVLVNDLVDNFELSTFDGTEMIRDSDNQREPSNVHLKDQLEDSDSDDETSDQNQDKPQFQTPTSSFTSIPKEGESTAADLFTFQQVSSPEPQQTRIKLDAISQKSSFNSKLSQSDDNLDNARDESIVPSSGVATLSDIVDSAKRLRNKLINEFNMDGIKGMKKLINQNVVPKDPSQIAEFLLKEPKLSKTKIGEYLGGGDEIHIQVLHSFVSKLDFTGLEFDGALRSLLKTFRLPGEAQKIDRIMGEFAKRYCENNPSVFSSHETGYVLAFSLIMLNTDAHNPNVKKKMTLQDFLRNNRGIDKNKNLPDEFMEKLYNNIVNNEIKMKEHDNMYIIKEITDKISGKFENIVAAHRRYIGQFRFYQIEDYLKPNTHRGERALFLFNDTLLVTKTRLPENQAVKSGEQPFSFKYMFNLVQVRVVDRPNNKWHTNVIELANPNGRLIGMSFKSAQDKHKFCKTIQDYIQEVQDMEEDKMNKLKATTQMRSDACKTLMLKLYDFNYTERVDSPKLKHMFGEYKNMRYARQVLTAWSTLITGTRKKTKQADAFPEIKPFEKMLNEFADSRVTLLTPSACPGGQGEQTSDAREDDGSENGSVLVKNDGEESLHSLRRSPSSASSTRKNRIERE